MNHLVVLSGVPGSGKSHLSKAIKESVNKHIYVISSDAIRKEMLGDQRDLSQDDLVWKMYYSLVKVYAQDKDAVVVLDATHASKKYRLETIKPYRELYDQIDLICFQLDKETVLRQNKDRDNPIPEDALLKLIDSYELPDEEEKAFFDHIDYLTNHEIEHIISRYK